jgi:hypothetical protein
LLLPQPWMHPVITEDAMTDGGVLFMSTGGSYKVQGTLHSPN